MFPLLHSSNLQLFLIIKSVTREGSRFLKIFPVGTVIFFRLRGGMGFLLPIVNFSYFSLSPLLENHWFFKWNSIRFDRLQNLLVVVFSRSLHLEIFRFDILENFWKYWCLGLTQKFWCGQPWVLGLTEAPQVIWKYNKVSEPWS